MKKWFLALMVFLFLLAMFIDQNTVPVPLKVFMTGPFHVHLSIIIGVSMLTGIALTTVFFLFIKRSRSRQRKKMLEIEDEVTV